MKKGLIRINLYFILFFISCLVLSAYDRGREIRIIYDFDHKELCVFKITKHENKKEPAAITFQLISDDRIMLGIKSKEDPKLFSMDYKLIPANTPYVLPSEIGALIPTKADEKSQINPDVVVNVSDDLISGGKLLVEFIKKGDDGVNEESHKFIFKIKSSYPVFMPSTGVVISNATNPSIDIITNEKGDHILVYVNKDKTSFLSLRPQQDLIQFLNFRIWEGLYLSLGFPLTLSKKIYENPYVGFAFYPGQNLAYIIHFGITFHKETQISKSSGYVENQIVEETIQASSIPSEEKYHTRAYLGVAFRIK